MCERPAESITFHVRAEQAVILLTGIVMSYGTEPYKRYKRE